VGCQRGKATCTERLNAAPMVGAVDYSEAVKVGDVICVWDLETTSKVAKYADPVEVCFRFLKVVFIDGHLDLEELPASTNYDSLVRPLGGRIPADTTAVHRIAMKEQEGDGIRVMPADAPTLVEMKVAAGEAIARAATEAGQADGAERVWMLGHNSSVYDMTVMVLSLQRAGVIESGGWTQLLARSGVVGVIDSLSVLGGKFKALTSIGINANTGKDLGFVYAKVFGGRVLPNAHRAAGDVEGLVAILTQSEALKACMLTETVGQGLQEWVNRKTVLAARKEWEQARDVRLASAALTCV